ncbi:hypothetical protein K501DRAFT_296415 [Backusella circina FSU 941]|nr:hypothetical protein K501DRAFT_296415 [Backusella circina FSU 941]
MSLLDLPNELILYIFTDFLDLTDLWCLLHTNSQLRLFASNIIHTKWKIETRTFPDTIMKIQCRSALIALEALSTQLSLSQQQQQKTSTQEKLKLFKDLIAKEEKLHDRIIQGIASYRHKYVLIEDIDIRNRIRTAVDVIFHHAVFVSSISRCNNIACTTTDAATSKNRALAAVLVRLLTKLDAAFPSYCREITYTLSENIKAFLEYTGYKLLATRKPPSLWVILHSISACFDLMGAAFVGKILADSHVECAVQRTCELLIEGSLRHYKRSLLIDLLENWLTVKREMSSSELCRNIRLEIESSMYFVRLNLSWLDAEALSVVIH